MTPRRCRLLRLLLPLLLLLSCEFSAAQEAGVVTPADNATGTSSGDSAAATVVPVVNAAAEVATPSPSPTTTPTPTETAATVVPTDVPATTTAAPELQALSSSGSSSSSIDGGLAGSSSASGSIDGNSTLVPSDIGPQDATTGSHQGPLTRAKLIVIIVVATTGACVMLGLLGWCCIHRKREGGSKTMSSPLPVTVPEPEPIVGGAYEMNIGPYEVGRTNSNAMIAVMGDPVERKQSRASRITRLSLHRESVSNARHLSNASDHQPTSAAMVMAPAYRLSRPLGSTSSPSSLRSNGQFKNTNQSIQSFRDFDFSTIMSETSSADDRQSYSSLADYQSQRTGGGGSNRAVTPMSPTVAVLELHRFSGTSSTASMSSLSSFNQEKRGRNPRVPSFVAQDLTQPSLGDFRRSSGGDSSRLSSSSTEDLAQASTRGADGGDSRRLEWYNSIKSPAEDDRYTRLDLSAGDSEDEEEGLSSNERQSYEL